MNMEVNTTTNEETGAVVTASNRETINNWITRQNTFTSQLTALIDTNLSDTHTWLDFIITRDIRFTAVVSDADVESTMIQWQQDNTHEVEILTGL